MSTQPPVQIIDEVRIFTVPVTDLRLFPQGLSVPNRNKHAIVVMACEAGKCWQVRFIGHPLEFNQFVEQEGILIRVGRLCSRIPGASRPTSYAGYMQRTLETAGNVSAVTLKSMGLHGYTWTAAQLSSLAPSFRCGLTLLPSNGGLNLGRHIRKNPDVQAMVRESLVIKKRLKSVGYTGSITYTGRPEISGNGMRINDNVQADIRRTGQV